MNSLSHNPPFDLFYCASDADQAFAAKMQNSVALLKSSGLLREWSYVQTVPGCSITHSARRNMDTASILVFLLSPDFLNSAECMEQWEYAGQRASTSPQVFRVPVIIRECPWQDILGSDDPMPLPRNGRAINSFEDADVAWLEVYDGVKQIVEHLRFLAVPKTTFVRSINELEIPSIRDFDLQDLYVFPYLRDEKIPEQNERLSTYPVRTERELLAIPHVIVHGADQSGKTALARFLCLTLVNSNAPVLLLTDPTDRRIDASFFRKAYEEQYNGDYDVWDQQSEKTIIIDGIHPGRRGNDLLKAVRDKFEKIVLILPSDVYYSMYFDDINVAEFQAFTIQPLTLSLQEQLIRKRLSLKMGQNQVPDGYVDRDEERVNHIIVSNRVVPRFPFFVLSILESFETFMPGNVPITSFGHCYSALIVSRLIHAGISNSDDAINACFNFLEELAYATYKQKIADATGQIDLPTFVAQYDIDFIIHRTIINRLKHPDFGVINENGTFRTDYIYYFMLGKYLANSQKSSPELIADICEHSHIENNFLTILFTIHHTNDHRIVDDILLRTMVTLDEVEPADLSITQTRAFGRILGALPASILPEEPVAAVRARTRDAQDQLSNAYTQSDASVPADPLETSVTNMLRIFRNSKIMGQVLRTKHGSLNITKIEEIIAIIADAGLRLIALSLL